MKKDPYKKALSYAYKLLGVRPRSTKEMYSRLKDRGYPKQIIDEVTKKLKKENQLDDLKFAKVWIENRLFFNPKGIAALRYELKEKGLPASVIDKAINDMEIGVNEYEIAKDLTIRKIGELGNLSEIKRKKKIQTFLCRRGFDFEVIDRILEEMI